MNKSKKIALHIKNVSKEFILPHQKADSIKSVFVSPFKSYTKERQKALSNVSLEIEEGEFFGIVGRNGSGKSTLLKCIAGVYKPDTGTIKVNGTLVPFIELGVGFNSDLSGRDNVYLNGAMLGFSREEMSAMYDEIVEFAELEEFMDQKLKNYSSGMQVRLAFSIAIRAKTDILLLDEVLAVGDSAFKKKCNDYFYDLKRQKKTIILVTHSMASVEQYCDRAMIIDKGKILNIGKPREVADMYNELNFRSASERDKKRKDTEKKEKIEESLKEHGEPTKATIENVETFNVEAGKYEDSFKYNEKIGVRFFVKVNEDIESPTVGVVFRDKFDNRIFATNTHVNNVEIKDQKKGNTFQVEFIVDNVFDNTDYTISGAVASKDRSETYHRLANICSFQVFGWKMMNSMVNPPHHVIINYV